MPSLFVPSRQLAKRGLLLCQRLCQSRAFAAPAASGASADVTEAARENARRRGLSDAEIDAAAAAGRLPNWTHPESPVGGESANRVVRLIGRPPTPRQAALGGAADARTALEGLRLLASRRLSLLTGSRTHYLRGRLAMLEPALVRLALDTAAEYGFQQIGVPELVPPELVAACGFPVDGARSQVFLAERCQPGGQMALIGTAEIALAGYVAGGRYRPDQLPLRLCAVSRCYRREVSRVEDALYRVPQFTKVELFCVSYPGESESEHARILSVQAAVLEKLELHCRLLDMATGELGDPAYRKFDWEAWMPHEGRFGELCSASNCTDYQSRRLDVRTDNGAFAHTLNGTACAVTRTIKAIVEWHQLSDSQTVRLPRALAVHLPGEGEGEEGGETSLTLLRRPSTKATYFHKLQRQPML